MREIKFRAWDKTINKMRDVKVLDFNIGELCGISDGIYPYAHLNNVELMQFTGLKDANGTEIYEDDIGDLTTYQAIIGKQVHRVVVKWNEDRFSFEKKGKEIWHCDIRSFALNFKKLGNIWENGDLI